jgi:2-polyprenyl-3-methyl-5-hydroxy-6-metoxy-1,4-benzoquinol methylase
MFGVLSLFTMAGGEPPFASAASRRRENDILSAEMQSGATDGSASTFPGNASPYPLRVLKQLVKRGLARLGFELRRLPPEASPTDYRAHIESPLTHNSRRRLGELYGSEDFLKSEFTPDRLAFYRRVIEFACKQGIELQRRRILDVGCGAGHLLAEIGRRFEPTSLTGIEYVEEAVNVSKRLLPEARFFCMDVCEKRLPERFDVVFCTEVLEHLSDPEKALRSVAEMVAEGGAAVVTVPNGRVDTFQGHINFWSPESWSIFTAKTVPEMSCETGLMDQQNTNYLIMRRSGAASRSQPALVPPRESIA